MENSEFADDGGQLSRELDSEPLAARVFQALRAVVDDRLVAQERLDRAAA